MNQQRQPQQERAVRTRSAILAAALDALAEQGAASASTANIATRAGVSQGALFGHFATKADLWSAAVEHLLDELYLTAGELLADALAAGATDAVAAIDAGVDALWRVFNDPRLVGAYELFLAARTDAALASAIGPVLDAHGAREVALARTLFPEVAAARADFDALVLGLLATLQGAAVGTASRAGAGSFELAFIRDIARRELLGTGSGS